MTGQSTLTPARSDENEELYTGSPHRWMSAPGKPTLLFAHDFQTWLPLEFDASGAIVPLRFVENFTIQLRSLKHKYLQALRCGCRWWLSAVVTYVYVSGMK